MPATRRFADLRRSCDGIRPHRNSVRGGAGGSFARFSLPRERSERRLLAATLTTDAVYQAFLAPVGEKRAFFHGHSYTGNPLACAAALASLDLFEAEKILERTMPVVRALAAKLASIAQLEHVGEVRQRGMMVGVELVADRATKAEFPYADRVGHQVCLAARKRGVLLRPLGNVVVLMPPLSLTVSEAEWLGDVVKKSIDEVTLH